MCLFAFEIIYFTSIALPKLAIICLYLRIFEWRGMMRTVAWVLFTLTALTSVSLVVAACFQCIPIQFFVGLPWPQQHIVYVRYVLTEGLLVGSDYPWWKMFRYPGLLPRAGHPRLPPRSDDYGAPRGHDPEVEAPTHQASRAGVCLYHCQFVSPPSSTFSPR